MGEALSLERDFVVGNTCGIHARPAALLVKTASKFSCDIMIGKSGEQVSAKSIMGLLIIEGHCGATLTVSTSGSDADEAMEKIAELFENNFFEE